MEHFNWQLTAQVITWLAGVIAFVYGLMAILIELDLRNTGIPLDKCRLWQLYAFAAINAILAIIAAGFGWLAT